MATKATEGSVKSDIKSPSLDNKSLVSALGGLPAEKEVKEIAKVNSPAGRAKAPGSVRV